MRLRNKKAREVYTLGEDVHIAHTEGGRIEVEIVLESGGFAREYFDSLAELNGEWEDVKEPLIKDEKIRKAVRVWAETNQSKFIRRNGNYTASDNRGLMIEFNKSWTTYMENGKKYTIEELCGEEEE